MALIKSLIQRENTAETKPYSSRMWFVLAIASLLLSLEVVSGVTALTVAQIGKLTGLGLSHQAASVLVTAVLLVVCVVAAEVATEFKCAAWNRMFVLIGSGVCALLFIIDFWKAIEVIKVFAPTLVLILVLESLRFLYNHRLALEQEVPQGPDSSAIIT